MHTHTFYMPLYIFLLLHPPCSSFPSTCRDSTWTQAASLLSVGARPGRNRGLCVWRVKTAGGGGGWWCGGVGWGGLLLLHLAFLGWVSGLSSALFRGFPGSRARPSTMTAAGGPGSRVVGKFHLECYSERKGRSCAELESALVTEGSRLYSV